MASEPKDYTIFIWMILTSNTEATENKVEFLNYSIHSSNNSQLFELKGGKTTTKQYTLFKCFLCDIL